MHFYTTKSVRLPFTVYRSPIHLLTNLPTMKPLYLLADSALLFQENQAGLPALHSIRTHLENPNPLAVYIGASNGDAPEFYEIFQAGMERLGITRQAHVHGRFSEKDRLALEAADVILLAGGDPFLGWKVLNQTGMRSIIEQKYREGCILLGISAGAMHLSWEAFDENQKKYHPMMQLAPFTLDVHDERNDWKRLKTALPFSTHHRPALAISSGTGVVVQADGLIRKIGKEVYEFWMEGEEVKRKKWGRGER